MPVRFAALFLMLCLTTILSSVTFAAAPVVEPTGMWSGKIKDLSFRKLAPKSGFIADAETWRKLWTAWRPDEELPKADFGKELILVGTVPGPNLVSMRPTIDDRGNVRFTVAGTEIAGPGFGYRLIGISRDCVKTVNGKALTKKKPAVEDSINVTVVGTLRTGIFAIGGETTGTTITAKGITWELDLGKNAAMRKAAQKFNGKKVIVQGSLERRKGVEIKERWIVTITGIQAVGDAGVGGIVKPAFHATVGRTNGIPN